MKKTLLLLLAIAASGITQAADSITQGKLITQLSVPTSRDARAQFAGLRPEALQMGLGEAVLISSTDYQAQPDGSQRVTARWHSIAAGSNMAVTQPLQSPLSSQFRTSDKQVAPGTTINIRGDLDLLAEDFLKLKARLGKDSPRDVQKTTNNTTSTDSARNANELASSGTSGGGTGNYSNAPYSTTNSNNDVKTDMVTTQWQDCQPRIDRTTGKVFQQARKLEVTESGRLMSTGSCEDHGSTATIERTYDGDCQPVIDVDNRKVYHQFIEWAKLNGTTVDVSACTVDFAKFDTVKATTENCGYRHDFTAGRSIQQERLFYNDLAGKVVEVRSCGDSTQAFAQYTTTTTCPPSVDTINKQVFINQRVAFMDGNGAEQYASDCKPDGNPSLPISEAFCDPKYEHDFVNNVSYYRTRAYYVDQKGNTVYVTNCGRSSADSFSHIFETGACGVRNDDEKLMTYWKKLTQINTPSDGLIEIAPCQEIGSPTPYVYTEAVTGSAVVAQSGTLSSYGSLKNRLPNEDWASAYNEFSLNDQCFTGTLNTVRVLTAGNSGTFNLAGKAAVGASADANFQVFECTDYGNDEQCRTSGWGVANTVYSNRILKTPKQRKYMRPDGTYFFQTIGHIYKADVGCTPYGGGFTW